LGVWQQTLRGRRVNLVMFLKQSDAQRDWALASWCGQPSSRVRAPSGQAATPS
jgi:hypothetical protein